MAAAEQVRRLVATIHSEHPRGEHDPEFGLAGVSATAPHLSGLRPSHLSMERFARRTALLVVDLQNVFADPVGSLSVVGGDAVVPVVNAAVDEALAAGAMIVATQDWHPE